MVVYLFDFDGTLVESTGAVEKALRIAIEKTIPAVIESDLYDEFDDVITFKGTKDMLKKFENLRELYPDEPFVWVDDSPSRFTYILDENTLLVQKASPYKSDVALLFERQNFIKIKKIKSIREVLEIDEGLSAFCCGRDKA